MRLRSVGYVLYPITTIFCHIFAAYILDLECVVTSRPYNSCLIVDVKTRNYNFTFDLIL